ncbi:unnamed protein product [Ixodes persulcatus]
MARCPALFADTLEARTLLSEGFPRVPEVRDRPEPVPDGPHRFPGGVPRNSQAFPGGALRSLHHGCLGSPQSLRVPQGRVMSPEVPQRRFPSVPVSRSRRRRGRRPRPVECRRLYCWLLLLRLCRRSLLAARLGRRLRRRSWLRGSLAPVRLVLPLVLGAAARVHEEVSDGAELQAQLLRDGDLHLLGGPLGLLKDGLQGAPLQVGEHEARLLGLVLGRRPGHRRGSPTRGFLFPLAGCATRTWAGASV